MRVHEPYDPYLKYSKLSLNFNCKNHNYVSKILKNN